MFTFFRFSESGLYLLSGFDLYFERRDTEKPAIVPCDYHAFTPTRHQC